MRDYSEKLLFVYIFGIMSLTVATLMGGIDVIKFTVVPLLFAIAALSNSKEGSIYKPEMTYGLIPGIAYTANGSIALTLASQYQATPTSSVLIAIIGTSTIAMFYVIDQFINGYTTDSGQSEKSEISVST